MSLVLDLKSLNADGHLDLEVPPETANQWSEHLVIETANPVKIDLKYRFSDQGLFLEGILQGTILSDCHRCNEPTPGDVELKVRARYLEGTPPRLGERRQDEEGKWGVELDEEAGELEYYSGHHLDLTDWLRDEWALGLPVSLHCGSEACREGAAGGQETGISIDPRWQFLADLKAQMEEEG